MATRNSICEWFGHREESTGQQPVDDFPSEGFVCVRCGFTHSVYEGSQPPPAPKIRFVVQALLAVALLSALLYLGIPKS